MLELEENLRLLNELLEKLNSLEGALDISNLKLELSKLQEESTKDGFWDDQASSNKVFAKIKKLERKINSFETIKNNLDNLIEMNGLLTVEFDEELVKDLILQSSVLKNKIDKLELETVLSRKI